MLGYKLYFLLFISSLYSLIGAGKKHWRNTKNTKRFHFHRAQDINELMKNPASVNSDEADEINQLDSMNRDVFLNPEISSESQDLSRQGLDPYVAVQISKLDHNFQDILGPSRPKRPRFSNARQKGDILQGYAGQQYNADGSISLSNSEWPEYQMKDTPPMTMANMQKQGMDMQFPGAGNGESNTPQISPQAALNPNLLPGQKSDQGMGMGVSMDMAPGMEMAPGMGKNPGAAGPMMSRFVKGNDKEKSADKAFTRPPFAKPGIKNAGFRIPGEFSFKQDGKSADSQEEANFVKNFLSSKKSRTEKRKTSKNANQ